MYRINNIRIYSIEITKYFFKELPILRLNKKDYGT